MVFYCGINFIMLEIFLSFCYFFLLFEIVFLKNIFCVEGEFIMRFFFNIILFFILIIFVIGEIDIGEKEGKRIERERGI